MAALAASEGKAEDIMVLDVDGISNVTDTFLIFTGQSPSHLRAVANRVLEALKAHGHKPSGSDGARSPGWVAYDYGNLIIHGMLDEVRRYYEIERLWGDARIVDWENQPAGALPANN
jgi:ribosome-associated protein